MRFGSSLHAALTLLTASALLSGIAVAQQTESVAEAARRAREQKKNAKSTKVITDDDLNRGKAGEGLNVIGPEQPENQAPPVTAPQPRGDSADAAKKAAGEDAEIAKLKEQVSQSEKELDLLQRELALDQDAYYAKPDFSNDTAGKAKLDSEKQRIADKQQELERLKIRLSALQELQSRRKPAQAGAANPPPGNQKPATPPPPQP